MKGLNILNKIVTLFVRNYCRATYAYACDFATPTYWFIEKATGKEVILVSQGKVGHGQFARTNLKGSVINRILWYFIFKISYDILFPILVISFLSQLGSGFVFEYIAM